ncbi:hypothetical protein VTN02DRAFT_3247 [Thermoascus thermophilus]
MRTRMTKRRLLPPGAVRYALTASAATPGPQARQTRLGALFLPLSPSPPPRAPLVMAHPRPRPRPALVLILILILILHMFLRSSKKTARDSFALLRHTASVDIPPSQRSPR